MRLSLASALCVVVAFAAEPAAAAPRGFVPPHWLLGAEHVLLKRGFENAKPMRVDYIPYPKKIAVIFEFRRVVVCGLCSAPTASSLPRGRVIRVSFDRTTHDLAGARDGWAMQFCEVAGGRPPKSRCLHR